MHETPINDQAAKKETTLEKANAAIVGDMAKVGRLNISNLTYLNYWSISLVIAMVPLCTLTCILVFMNNNPGTKPKNLVEAIVILIVAITMATILTLTVSKAIRTALPICLIAILISFSASLCSGSILMNVHLPTFLKGIIEKKKEIKINDKRFMNSIGMEFIKLDPSNFKKRIFLDNEKTNEFMIGGYLQATEVTQEQWMKVMGNNPSYFQDCGENCPIENVSYDDVKLFIKRLNELEDADCYRLPTIEEWQYAALASVGGIYCYGNNEMNLSNYAWFKNNSSEAVHPVAQLQPNSWGFYDMHGNVWEWCDSKYETIDKDNSSLVYFSIIGGSWKSHPRDCGVDIIQGALPAETHNYHIGFRVFYGCDHSLHYEAQMKANDK